MTARPDEAESRRVRGRRRGVLSGKSSLSGRVTQVLGVRCRVEAGEKVLSAVPAKRLGHGVRGKKNLVAVGDEVKVADRPRGALIEEVLTRRNQLSRRMSFTGAEHVVAANFDLLAVMLAPNPALNTGLLDRYLTAAFGQDFEVLILCNKKDLLDGPGVDRAMEPYAALGLPILRTCALTGEGVEAFKESARGRWTVLVGHSGVGKTTWINALMPGLDLPVGEVDEERGKGRHTTERATAFRWQEDSLIVDTAGIREFSPYIMTPLEVENAFVEIHEAGGSCRYPNCLHETEPACGVKAAVERGTVSGQRYRSYLRLMQEARCRDPEDRPTEGKRPEDTGPFDED